MTARRRSLALICTSAALAAAAGALQPAPASAGKFGKRTLSQGMRGKDVRSLQRHLNVLELRTKATGRFGRQTRRNVRRYERSRGWRVDGRVQRRQAKKIKRAVRKLRERRRAQLTVSGAPVFPIPGPHDYGGSGARFGASRSGHSHQGQDVFAACGERLYSAQAGNVKVVGYQGSGAGHYVVVDGTDGIDYVYMHLQKASWATRGAWVYAGTQIGRVGASGNASGCHLHFEMWTAPGWYSGGYPFDPFPSLVYWDSYS